MPRVWNKKSETPPRDAVYIGRPSKWGNPFPIGPNCTRAQSIAKYEQYLLNSPELLAALPELKGKDVVCFCAPLPCHGDVLIKYANQEGDHE